MVNQTREQKIYFNPKEDGPVIYHLIEGEEEGYSNKQDIMGLDTLYQSDTDYYRLEIPFGMKLLMLTPNRLYTFGKC